MDISVLRECVDLVDTLSFSATARRFYVSQPTLSSHIANIEGEIGAKIVQRSKNGIAFTKEGRAFVRGAEKVLQEYERTLEEIRLIQAGQGDIVKLGYLYGAVSTLLAPVLHEFTKTHEDSPITYVAYEATETLRALDTGEINAVVTTTLIGFDPELYVSIPLYRDALCLIVPKTHCFAEKACIRVDDLAGEDLILSEKGIVPGVGDMLESVLDPVKNSIHIRKRFKGIDDLRMLLLVEGCGTVMFSHLKHFMGTDQLAFVPIQASGNDFFVSFVFKRADETQAILDLAECFKAECARQGIS